MDCGDEMTIPIPQTKFTLMLRDKNTKLFYLIPYLSTSIGFSSNYAPYLDEIVQRINDLFLVREDDDGIRPAGKPDACFYCNSKVGYYHSPECVILTRNVKYSVIVEDQVVGTYIYSDPIGWDVDMCEYHKNDSSWCTGTALDDGITWLDTSEAKTAQTKILELPKESCPCGILSFKFEEAENWPKGETKYEFISIYETR